MLRLPYRRPFRHLTPYDAVSRTREVYACLTDALFPCRAPPAPPRALTTPSPHIARPTVAAFTVPFSPAPSHASRCRRPSCAFIRAIVPRVRSFVPSSCALSCSCCNLSLPRRHAPCAIATTHRRAPVVTPSRRAAIASGTPRAAVMPLAAMACFVPPSLRSLRRRHYAPSAVAATCLALLPRAMRHHALSSPRHHALPPRSAPLCSS
ncbi:hypothetical protein DENSPDRAFT_887267 [Dentipellis sp. KUC8613]|nr:hypothetical protein DENSPDRAFT_887267 [Dentipellis sp. KUC8613]